jgi:hypothetical protein
MTAKEPASRTGIDPAERALRSKLTQIVSSQGLIRGTLLDRQRRCGNPGCHCAKGPGHPAVYLILSDGKRQRQLYVPKDWHDRVRQWVDNHRKARELIHAISELHWNRVKGRQG